MSDAEQQVDQLRHEPKQIASCRLRPVSRRALERIASHNEISMALVLEQMALLGTLLVNMVGAHIERDATPADVLDHFVTSIAARLPADEKAVYAQFAENAETLGIGTAADLLHAYAEVSA